MNKNKIPFIVVCIFASFTIACGLTSRAAPKPTATPPPTVVVSTEAVATLESNLQEAVNQAENGGQVSLQITEAELTSYVVLKLQNQVSLSIQNPQVFLRDGHIQLTGQAEQSGLTLTLDVVVQPVVDTDGKITLVLSSLKFGSISVPKALSNTIATELDKVYASYLDSFNQKYFIQSVTIAEGVMQIQGKIR